MGDNPNYPIATAATAWVDSQGVNHTRVYSTDGYNVSERCWDGDGWTTGGFSAPGSAVSATSYFANGAWSIRVYCTFEDKTVEWCTDGGGSWYQGAYTTT
jgi:hypothetical protein